MNKLLRFALFTLIMSTTAFASGTTDFDDAINNVFGDAANYFTFEGTFTSNSSNAKTITLSKVTRNKTDYRGGEPFSLAISGKRVWIGDTEITYTITLTNGATEDNHLFNFSNDRYPVFLTFFEDLVVPANCRYLFYGCRGLVDFHLYGVDTSNVTDMSYMFADCGNVSGLAQLNTSNVTNMSHMFAGCQDGVSLSNFDTRNVTDMSHMFEGCQRSISGLSSFDTSNVTDMNSMFVGCTGLKVLKVKSDFPGNPDMANEAMENMFEGRTVDHGKLIIFSDDTGFNPRFKNFVENYKDTVTLLHLVLKVDANKMLTFGQDADVSFGDGCGILFEDKSVLVNATDIKCPTEAGQMAYLVLADREISSTIENLLMIKHDKDFNEDTEHVYRVMPRGKISGNYKMITCDGDDTHNIAIVNSNEIYLEGLAGFTNADTVFFVVKKMVNLLMTLLMTKIP